MEYQESVSEMGGTMRLGSYPCWVQDGTKGEQAYGEAVVMERHRHRFEFNNSYRRKFSRKGMLFSGISPDKKLVEMVELKDHPWFVAVQFHPEFKSQVLKPHPLFSEFVKAALTRKTAGNEGKQ